MKDGDKSGHKSTTLSHWNHSAQSSRSYADHMKTNPLLKGKCLKYKWFRRSDTTTTQ